MTILAGERSSEDTLAYWSGLPSRDESDGWRVTGSSSFHRLSNSSNMGVDVRWIDAATERHGFNSVHRGRTSFVLADGSVHGIGDDIHPDVYSALGTINGKEHVELAIR